MLLLSFACLLAACSGDDDAVNGGGDDIGAGALVSEVTYEGNSPIVKMSFEYDAARRLCAMERLDSVLMPAIGMHGSSDENQARQTRYTYSYVSDSLIICREDFHYIERKVVYPPYLTALPDTLWLRPYDVKGHDSLFMSNNRIDSIVRTLDYVNNQMFEQVYTFALRYSDDSRLTGINQSYCDRNKSTGREQNRQSFTYKVNWEGDNIASITVNQDYLTNSGGIADAFLRGYAYEPARFTYTDKQGFLPTANVFTLFFRHPIGILANQGLFGKKTIKLLSGFVMYPKYPGTYFKNTIDYTFDECGISSCKVTNGTGESYRLLIKWN